MKTLLSIALALLFHTSVLSQDGQIQEPEFVGQAVILKSDGSFEQLEKSPATASVKAKLSLTNMMGGAGHKVLISLDGCCSLTKGELTNGILKLIIRAENNLNDPADIIQVIQFVKGKRDRTAEVFSVDALKGANIEGKVKRATFFGKKYGSSSYLLNISIPGPGEYGVFISPNGQTPVKFISTFSVN
jgi:hypothetical protein